MTSAQAGPERDLGSAVELVEQTTEEVWAQASRVSQAAIALREAMEARAGELQRAEEEFVSRRAAIDEEVQRARAEADAVLQTIRDEVAGQQAILAGLQRQHVDAKGQVEELWMSKELMLEQLGRAQDRLNQVLPAMDDLLRAKDTLHAVVTSFGEEPPAEASTEHDRVAKPIGRIMDVGDEDVDR